MVLEKLSMMKSMNNGDIYALQVLLFALQRAVVPIIDNEKSLTSGTNYNLASLLLSINPSPCS